MKSKLIRGFAFAAVLSLAGLAAEAGSGLTYVGCWSPYPNCAGASDIYQDSSGRYWDCGACGTTSNPSVTSCRQVSSSINNIGYWCS